MANVKFLEDKQTQRQTDRPKTISPQYINAVEHLKKKKNISVTIFVISVLVKNRKFDMTVFGKAAQVDKDNN